LSVCFLQTDSVGSPAIATATQGEEDTIADVTALQETDSPPFSAWIAAPIMHIVSIPSYILEKRETPKRPVEMEYGTLWLSRKRVMFFQVTQKSYHNECLARNLEGQKDCMAIHIPRKMLHGQSFTKKLCMKTEECKVYEN
jgi:hypothetical protein